MITAGRRLSKRQPRAKIKSGKNYETTPHRPAPRDDLISPDWRFAGARADPTCDRPGRGNSIGNTGNPFPGASNSDADPRATGPGNRYSRADRDEYLAAH